MGIWFFTARLRVLVEAAMPWLVKIIESTPSATTSVFSIPFSVAKRFLLLPRDTPKSSRLLFMLPLKSWLEG